ncbi:hypothetical protein [Terrihabitans sp. B22-R8]|uniref:hypothetical protein n=1 Tax=Terrihabitans sp. B22-R8 TaxID=3425128 RepID=UPI00403CDEE4
MPTNGHQLLGSGATATIRPVPDEIGFYAGRLNPQSEAREIIVHQREATLSRHSAIHHALADAYFSFQKIIPEWMQVNTKSTP